MNCCIYTKKDDVTATFNSAEHIFPKCFGGVSCLPYGWVSDEINNKILSHLELNFARQSPDIVLTRMFSAPTGRKRHKNRDHIGIFSNSKDSTDYSLGFIKQGKPYPINQICFTIPENFDEHNSISIKVTIAPSQNCTTETIINNFWNTFKNYNNSPVCINDKRLPPTTCLLGHKDNKWFLGISEKENAEFVKPKVQNIVSKIASINADELLSQDSPHEDIHHVSAEFRFCANLIDRSRMYAKIAFNCLARLKGQEYILNDHFDAIREAILTGNDIEKFVYFQDNPHLIDELLKPFPHHPSLGKHYHSTVLVTKEDILYGVVNLYGFSSSAIVMLGTINHYETPNWFICDWENHIEYTLEDSVKMICSDEHNEVFKE